MKEREGTTERGEHERKIQIEERDLRASGREEDTDER